jgi:transcriptional regulator with XRE-family HTH domain
MYRNDIAVAQGQVLRTLRKQQKKTLRQVSSLSTISLGHLSEVERGAKEVSAPMLDSWLNALSIKPSNLFYLTAVELRNNNQ